MSENCVHTPKQRHAPEEAYTVLQVQPPNLPHDNYTLRVKIDTGAIGIRCQRKNSVWDQATFYVVDVDGPAVVGLPIRERQHLVTINVDNVYDITSDRGKPKVMPAQIQKSTAF